MAYNRGDHMPPRDICEYYVALEQAMSIIRHYMRNQHNKDVVLGHLYSEVEELKRLVNN